MSITKLRELVVIINEGSGIIFQPKDESSTYLLTAKHVVTGSEKPSDGIPAVSKCSRLKKVLGKWKEVTIEFDKITLGVNYFPHEEIDICILKIGRLLDIDPVLRFEDLDNDRVGFLLAGYPSLRRIDKDIIQWFRFDESVTIKQETTNGLVEAHIPDLPSYAELVGFSGGGIVRLEENRISLAGIQIKMVDSHDEERLGRVEFTPLQYFDEIVAAYQGALNQMESAILESAVTSSLDLDQELRIQYIEDIENEAYYVDRIYRDDTRTYSVLDFFDDTPKGEGIGDILAKEEKIVVLGNPGLGKSFELRKLAIELWENGEGIPIYRNLKNFTETNTIEDYISVDISSIDSIILILDGVDEIPNIQDFLSKFENFIKRNKVAKKKIRYVLSCRTNIYNSVINSVAGFKAFFLQDLSFEDALNLLNDKCGDIVHSLEFNSELLVFITNPFQIAILSDYINQHKALPSNTAEIWEGYITKRLENDRFGKLAKIAIKVPLIKVNSKRVALVNELMKSNIISEDNLLRVLKENVSDYDEFVKNPLLDKSYNSNDWFFEHRNIQEYFAASVLKEHEFETIKEFICIKGLNRTHPSLFNTITFLLSLMDTNSEKFSSLIELISNNDPVQLFKTDSNRIEQIRGRVFQSFFTSECIEKTLWINTTKGIRTKEIAGFANNKENYKFLLSVVSDKSAHFRARISALDILSYFRLDVIDLEELQTFFKDILSQHDTGINIKTHTISCIYGLGLCQFDPKFLDWLVEHFKEESDKSLSRAMLDVINSMPSVDPYFSYLKNEFLFDNRILTRNTKDEVLRGNSLMLGKIILKLEDPNNLIDILSYYFGEKYTIRLEGELSKSLLDRLLYFAKREDDFIIRLLQKIGKIKAFYRQSDFLTILLDKSQNKLDIARILIKEQEFHVIRQMLAKIADKELCELIRNVHVSNPIDFREIEYFRNNLNNLKRDSSLAEYFNGIMEEIGFVFNESVFTSTDANAYELLRKARIQQNFNLLFDSDKLLQAVGIIFEDNGNSLTWERMVDIEHSWYQENSRSYNIDMQYDILRKFIRDYGTLSLEDFTVIFIQNEVIRFETIKSKLSNKNREFIVSEEQEELIRQWCFAACSIIDFANSITLKDQNSFVIHSDFRRMKLVLFFQKEFQLVLPKEFLLNCIEFISVDTYQGEGIDLESLYILVGDTSAFDERVTENLLQKRLFSLALSRHIEYALKRKLTKSYHKIKIYLSERSDIYPGDKILDDYIMLTKDKRMLEDFCTNIHSSKCWAAVAILMQQDIAMPFCITVALQYLDEKDDQYISNAMEVLFKSNHPRALKSFLAYLREGINISVDQSAFASYDVVMDVAIVKEIFAIIYGADYDRFSFNGGNMLLTTYLSNISKKDFDGVRKILIEIQSEVVAEVNDTGIFYINNLIYMCENAYINYCSNPYSFNEALQASNSLLKF